MGFQLPLPANTVPFVDSNNLISPVWYNWLKSVSDTALPWTVYTPQVASSGGALTTFTATGRFQRLGKIIFVQARVNITTVGVASGSLRVFMPVTPNPAFDYTLSGWEIGDFSGAEGIILAGDAFASVRYTSGASLVVNGNTAVITGVYEAA